MPNARAPRMAAILKGSQKVWYEPDALFAWSSIEDTDTAAVDPTLGSQLALKSAAQAVAGGGLWLMSNSNYASSTAMLATASFDVPFLLAMVVDKSAHAGSTNTLDVIGTNAIDSISFGTTSSVQPRMVVSINSVVTQMITQAAWSAAGTALVHWVYGNLSDATNTFQSGNNANVVTQSGKLTLTAGRTLSRAIVLGNTGGTTGIDFTKKGLIQFVSRAGMTLSDALAIVAKMKARQGI